MPRFGAHLSVAGGLARAVEAAVVLGCDTVQVFTKNASQWAGKPLVPADVKAFRDGVAAAGLQEVTAHDSYLINLASPVDNLYRRSVAAFADEIERAEAYGVKYLVTHPGAHTGSGEPAGLARVVDGLNEALSRTPGAAVKILIETTAGQGSCLGGRFEHIQYILDHVKEPERFDVCFDTCHVFAAGYPIGTPAEYEQTFAEFDRLVGLSRIRVFHVNDSVKGLGSRVDRHAGLGAGKIGEGAFRRLAADPRFADRAMILETPKEDDDGTDMDPVNLAKLRAFAAAAAVAA